MQPSTISRTPVAVFDYDGTCISGQSGSLISKWLLKRGDLSAHATVGLVWWGARYKFHLPYRQEHSRELIFHDLEDLSTSEIDALMVEFHNEVLVPLYRQRAADEIALRRAQGCATVIVSATFDPIAREAAMLLGADGYVATQMEQDALGNYTGNVSGNVVAGKAKVEAACAWADKTLGPNKWSLAFAYGDHHSDIELLSAARHPMAVSPGPTLRRAAHAQGWPIVDWEAR